jgi:hypothetical protein
MVDAPGKLYLFSYFYLFNEFVCKLGFFWYEWARLKREWNERFKGPRVSHDLSHLSKSVHIGENSQILSVEQKNKFIIQILWQNK